MARGGNQTRCRQAPVLALATTQLAHPHSSHTHLLVHLLEAPEHVGRRIVVLLACGSRWVGLRLMTTMSRQAKRERDTQRDAQRDKTERDEERQTTRDRRADTHRDRKKSERQRETDRERKKMQQTQRHIHLRKHTHRHRHTLARMQASLPVTCFAHNNE
jgi:hypothetical protein